MMSRYSGLQVDKEAELKRYKTLADRLRPMVAETVSYLNALITRENKSVLVEGANAALLDIDFGKEVDYHEERCHF